MKNNKILITINDLNDIKDLKELGIEKFVFPLKDFCVGIPNTFLISEIPLDIRSSSYLYLNRVLDNEGIDNFKLLKDIENFKGIIFDDLGIIPLIKDFKFEKILYLSHFNTNKESIKIYLEYVDSVIISSDITREETEDIVTSLPNVSLFVLGYPMAMYSRRLLINNYVTFHHLEKENPLVIKNSNQEFLIYENEYGTCFYHKPIFNGLSLRNLDCKYYFISSSFLDIKDVISLLNGESKMETDEGFLNKETIYKLKGESKWPSY